MQQERIINQLEKMVASGRIAPEEAERLWGAAGALEFDPAMGAIRARHAQAHTDAAVADGRMTRGEAESLVDRVRDGEHSAELRKQINETG